MKNNKSYSILGTTLLLATTSCFAQTYAGRSESSTTSEKPNSVLGEVQLTPLAGFTAINSTAGFNIGALAAYRPLLDLPLYFEPSLILGFFDRATLFNFDMGARFDIPLSSTKVRPFLAAALGPTFQTSGPAAVFNAKLTVGALVPLASGIDGRAEAGLVDIDGNAGFQFLAGIAL